MTTLQQQSMLLQILRNQLAELEGSLSIVKRHPEYHPDSEAKLYQLRIDQTKSVLRTIDPQHPNL